MGAVGKFRVRCRAEECIPGDRIPPEEYRQAAIILLQASGGMPKRDLINEVRALFGFARTGRTLEEAITAAVDELIAAGTVGEGSSGLMLDSSSSQKQQRTPPTQQSRSDFERR